MAERVTVTFWADEWPAEADESSEEYAVRVVEASGGRVDVLVDLNISPSAEAFGPGKPMTVHQGPPYMTVTYDGVIPGMATSVKAGGPCASSRAEVRSRTRRETPKEP